MKVKIEQVDVTESTLSKNQVERLKQGLNDLYRRRNEAPSIARHWKDYEILGFKKALHIIGYITKEVKDDE